MYGCSEDKDNINFYGNVIDQNGDPISGAKVHHEFVGGYLQKASGVGYRLTDEKGNFTLNGAGAYVVVSWISHPEIYYEAPIVLNDHETKVRIKNYKEFDTAETPKIFTVWRSKILENVRKSSTSSYLKTDSRIYTYDLTKGEFINERTTRRRKGDVIKTEGANDIGQLQVSCTRQSDVSNNNPRDVGDWSYTLTPVGGGIQKVDDTYLNNAPETGYSPSITVERLKNSPKRQHSFRLDNQRFYFTSVNANQKYYGSLIIDIDHSVSKRRKNTCHIIISFKINLEGGRNLAVDGKRREY